MIIKTAKYLPNLDGNNGDVILLTVKGSDLKYSVPVNTANRHYIAIQEWVADGNSIADAD